MQSDNVVLYSIKTISPIFYYVKAVKEELKMSPSVLCLCHDANMFLSADSDRDEPPSMLNMQVCKQGWGQFLLDCSIQFRSGLDAT